MSQVLYFISYDNFWQNKFLFYVLVRHRYFILLQKIQQCKKVPNFVKIVTIFGTFKVKNVMI